MEIPVFKKKKKVKIGDFSKLGKKSPKFHWEWGLSIATDNTKNIPGSRQLKL